MYSYEQVLKETTKYFENEELSAKVWIDKYALRDNDNNILELTPDDMHKRMAKEFARIEKGKFKVPYTEEEIYDKFKFFKKFIPQGSPMMGIGNKYQICSLSNCFVLESPYDSYAGILYTDQQLVQIAKRRGGNGLSLDNLRPTNFLTQNASRTSSGTETWMTRYSNSTREVGQKGRRGALMETISVHHPDVLIFATIKNDDTKVTGANISIKLTDEFLKAVENDTEYEQRWPVDSSTPKFSRMVKAREVWKTIIHSAWLRAEPGLLFWDNIIRNSPADCYAAQGYQTVATNPCITGDTLIAVADGRNAVSIRQLAQEGVDVPVYSVCPKTGQRQIKMGRNPRLTKIKTEVWKLLLDDGSSLIATPDHKIMKNDLTYVELSKLVAGDSINPFNSFDNNGYRQITQVGAKMIGGRFRNRRQYRVIHEFYSGNVVDAKQFAIHHIDHNQKNDSFANLAIISHNEHKKIHSENMIGAKNPYHKMSDEWKFNFSNHPGESNGRYLNCTNEDLVAHGKLLFSKNGKITKRMWYKYAKSNGLPQHLGNKFRFGSFANFKNQVATNHKVISVEFYGYEDVYNLTVDDNNNYDIITSYNNGYITSSGITVKNCGEIPLSQLDSCRLFAINLCGYIINAYTKNAYFDLDGFFDDVYIAQRLMDDLVDLELEAIDRILEKIKQDPEPDYIKAIEKDLWEKIRVACVNGRRTGLGITGLGDCLAAIGLKYGSKDSIKMVDSIYRTLKLASYRSSVEMAKELGAFPVWNWEQEKDCPFIVGLKEDSETLYKDISKYGRRNIANLTTAPTGSLSMLACIEVEGKRYHNITSGIEPVIMAEYDRKKKGNPGDKHFRSDEVDKMGDHWMKFRVYHAGIQAWLDTNKNSTWEESPYFSFTSADINWVKRVELQATAQKHVDHSISSTINLPADVSEEEVAKIYESAWKSGCKGITVYRDTCRSGVLVKTETGVPKHNAPERPKELPCDVYHITVKGKEYFVLVGLLGGDPYEVFAGRNGIIDDKVKRGTIIRVRKNFYKAILDDETELSPITLGCDEHEETITRLVSISLRHGTSIEFIVEQLSKIQGDMNSYAKSIARSLKKYIKDGVNTGEDCTECGSKLIYAEGCQKCINCGASKCS